jgi:hypothetical protein
VSVHPKWLLVTLGCCGILSGALGAMWLFEIRQGNLLEAWMTGRARAEAERLKYFELATQSVENSESAGIPKLEWEIRELKAKTPFALLNQPIVGTLLTLCIGGFLFSILSDRRERRNKRLEEALQLVDGVSQDLNSVFTHMFRYIREGNEEDSSKPRPTDKAEILSELNKKVPLLFEKRQSVSLKTMAFLPSDRQRFGHYYVLLIQELGWILDFLRMSEAPDASEVYVKRIKHCKDELANGWPLEHTPTGRKLKQPFKELDDWIEMIWERFTFLIKSTVKKLL